MTNAAYEVVKLDSKGRPVKTVYCCPSKAAAKKIAHEMRMVSGGKYRVRPCA